eukprot:scaffold9301_cov30-Tisochrysis_lutea.AAC.1
MARGRRMAGPTSPKGTPPNVKLAKIDVRARLAYEPFHLCFHIEGLWCQTWSKVSAFKFRSHSAKHRTRPGVQSALVRVHSAIGDDTLLVPAEEREHGSRERRLKGARHAVGTHGGRGSQLAEQAAGPLRALITSGQFVNRRVSNRTGNVAEGCAKTAWTGVLGVDRVSCSARRYFSLIDTAGVR